MFEIVAMKKLSFLLLLMIMLGGRASSQSISKPLSMADKAAIIQVAMEMRLKLDGPLKFSQYSVFRKGEMSAALLPKIPGFPFRMMSRAAINRRTQTPEGFRYLDLGFTQSDQFVGFELYIVERRGGLPMYLSCRQSPPKECFAF